jgi:hypothetical protein
MDKLLEQWTKDSGKCQFPENGKTLKEITSKIPNTPGVYIIYNSKGEIVYIGKAGTINQDGTFKKQGLRRRLNNQHHGMRREDYFISKIEDDDLDHIIIKWYEVNQGVIPGSAEGILIQEYFNKYGELPPWNEGF